MSFSLTQRRQGRRPTSGDQPTNEIPYLIRANPGESGEEEAALAALVSGAPPTLGTLVFKSARIEERLDGETYYGSANYASDATEKDTGDSTYSFDTTGGTFHITQSKATSRYPSGTAPDLNGAIGIDSEGNVEGVDITIPQYAFSETHYLADVDVDDAYKGLLFSLTGTTNNGTFRGTSAGETLFLGARGTQRGRGDWEISFEFAASPNVSGLTVGSITGVAKAGWDYLWVRYEKTTGGTGADKILIPVPKFVYVERVYDQADFSLLGI